MDADMIKGRELEKASPHTVKKFELIESYMKSWAQKLLNTANCEGIVFIDCMSNSGIYADEDGTEVYGTPIRVSNYLSEIMGNYSDKKARCYFNDKSAEKIEILNCYLPPSTDNFCVKTFAKDGNILLRELRGQLGAKTHTLLIYDPYDATINWESLEPFLDSWADIILTHAVSDTIRALSQAKRRSAIEKYEQTYKSDIKELHEFGGDRRALEKRIQEIMARPRRRSTDSYHIASFPFFNSKNTVVYHLLLGTRSQEGFSLFKKEAWKTFGGKSSLKDTRGHEKQLMIDFNSQDPRLTSPTDMDCYYVYDIAEHLHSKFEGRADVPLEEIWESLRNHLIFPSDGYRDEIKQFLKNNFGCKISRSSITFS